MLFETVSFIHVFPSSAIFFFFSLFFLDTALVKIYNCIITASVELSLFMSGWWSGPHAIFQVKKSQCWTLQWRCQISLDFELCGVHQTSVACHPLTRTWYTEALRGLLAIGRKTMMTLSLSFGVWGIRQLATKCARFVVDTDVVILSWCYIWIYCPMLWWC